MNKAILVGNLTRDPEHRSTTNGLSVTTFSVAVSRRFKNAEGQQQADFIPVVTWRGLADNCAKFLVKGSKVGVTGAIQVRNYDDKDGVKRYVTEIVADEVEFLGRPNNSSAGNNSDFSSPPPPPPQSTSSDDLFSEELSDFQPLDDAELPF